MRSNNNLDLKKYNNEIKSPTSKYKVTSFKPYQDQIALLGKYWENDLPESLD